MTKAMQLITKSFINFTVRPDPRSDVNIDMQIMQWSSFRQTIKGIMYTGMRKICIIVEMWYYNIFGQVLAFDYRK